ncbi:MAG TPA: branched-chain amino acid ABC transporter permease [Burkholderiaceae bacterium]|nr:branched-chain amino acid ABC transporter permease [Burkholderiaceae bacterium]
MTTSWLIALAALLALVFTADNYVLRLATTVGMYAALAWAWNLIGGYAGYPSFATAAFFGLGAYAAGVFQSLGLPFPLAWPLAGLLVAVFAGLLGRAILHLRGHYFAIASLVIADVLREVTNVWTDVTGGGMGLSLPLLNLGGVDGQTRFYFLAMALMAVLALLISWGVDRSRLGVALRCIEQNEDAAQVIGIDTRASKVAVFMLSGLLAGATGAVYASWVTYIDPTDVYDVSLSVKPIVMALIGGVGTLMGPLIGAAVFLGLEELLWRNVLEFHAGLLGLLVVALVLFLPGGVRDLRRYGLWSGWVRYVSWRRKAS